MFIMTRFYSKEYQFIGTIQELSDTLRSLSYQYGTFSDLFKDHRENCEKKSLSQGNQEKNKAV